MSKIKKSELMNTLNAINSEPERLRNMIEGRNLIIEKLKILEDQVNLFEAERKQLVEAAFDSSKKCRRLSKSMIDKDMLIATISSNVEDVSVRLARLKINYSKVKLFLMFSLIANLAFTLYLVLVF